MNKHIFLTGLGLLLITTPVFAEVSTKSAIPKRLEVRTTIMQDRMVKFKSRADAEIERRIASLNATITHIQEMKRLTSEEKTSMTTDVQKLIADLTALKAKIDAETDTAMLKTDIQSIVKDYRVYAIQLPKTRMLLVADIISSQITTLNNLVNKLQTRIEEEKGKGVDITSFQKNLDDMKAKIDDAQKQASQIATDASNLTPIGYPANKSVVEATKKLIQTAREDIKAAIHDAKAIQQGLISSKLKPTTT